MSETQILKTEPFSVRENCCRLILGLIRFTKVGTCSMRHLFLSKKSGTSFVKRTQLRMCYLQTASSVTVRRVAFHGPSIYTPALFLNLYAVHTCHGEETGVGVHQHKLAWRDKALIFLQNWQQSTTRLEIRVATVGSDTSLF